MAPFVTSINLSTGNQMLQRIIKSLKPMYCSEIGPEIEDSATNLTVDFSSDL